MSCEKLRCHFVIKSMTLRKFPEQWNNIGRIKRNILLLGIYFGIMNESNCSERPDPTNVLSPISFSVNLNHTTSFFWGEGHQGRQSFHHCGNL